MATDYLAYCTMMMALKEIIEIRDAQPWEADMERAAWIARSALDYVEELADGA